MPQFTQAVVKATGRKQRIPEAWLEHPVLAEPFRQTPRNTARTAPAPKRTAKGRKASPPAAPATGTPNAPASGDQE